MNFVPMTFIAIIAFNLDCPWIGSFAAGFAIAALAFFCVGIGMRIEDSK